VVVGTEVIPLPNIQGGGVRREPRLVSRFLSTNSQVEVAFLALSHELRQLAFFLLYSRVEVEVKLEGVADHAVPHGSWHNVALLLWGRKQKSAAGGKSVARKHLGIK
jgi:hypothetical protein